MLRSLASETGGGGSGSGTGEVELLLGVVDDASGVAFSGDEASFKGRSDKGRAQIVKLPEFGGVRPLCAADLVREA